MFFQIPGFQPLARYAQKTVTFHLDFDSEIVEQARHENRALFSLENLRLANKALGRRKGE
jgi:hypothetical protein